jgi:16S rRNA (cytosine967-C5)-methyltransferase
VPLFEGPAFAKGWFQVQDEAAQAVSYLLDPQPGHTVLDACAGLGGKTAHIAALMGDEGTIRALDRDARKLRKLDQEMRRLGIGIVSSQPIDLQIRILQKQDWGEFDRILLDAPCSGLGVIRRNPDTKWTRSVRDIERCAANQMQLLHHLALALKPNGILVYAVCSTEPEETEATIDAFLKEWPNFAIEGAPPEFPASLMPLLDEKGRLKTAPHRTGTDGFFAVRLRRRY